MRTLRFHEYGDPTDVLHLEDAETPTPSASQIRVTVQACGLTPADWALCGGLFAGDLPRGIGLEVAGMVDAVGKNVHDVTIGDAVFGPAPYTGPTAGASEYALLDTWFARPAGLDPVHAAALPMAVETARRSLDCLGPLAGKTVLISGAGTTVGYAAAQMALHEGARVIATAGATYAEDLRGWGAEVTGYGEGLADRVRDLAGGIVDLAFDAAPAGTLAEVVKTVDTPDHVVTAGDLSGAKDHGVRLNLSPIRNDALGQYAELAAAGEFSIPIAGTYPLENWRTPLEISRSGQARGKHILTIG